MAVLIWIGATVSIIGLSGIIYSIVTVARAKRANLTDEELRARVSKVLPINMGALLFSVLGLMMVIVGISLS